jgi:hypothetical protein
VSENTWWETTKLQGSELLETVKELIREGNVRRIVIAQGDRTIAEFPLTAGVVGAVLAPVLAAIGALAALLTECSISIERERPAPGEEPPGSAPTPEPKSEVPGAEESV